LGVGVDAGRGGCAVHAYEGEGKGIPRRALTRQRKLQITGYFTTQTLYNYSLKSRF
jgi:hypothetical protein